MKLKNLVAALMLSVTLMAPVSALAQEGDSGALPADEVREAVGSILLGGLVGGVLGLSTLSFYDKPQDHIRNITYGAGAGVILASLYLTLNVVKTSSTSSYGYDLGKGLYLKPVAVNDQSGLGLSW